MGCLITTPSSFQALPPVTTPIIVDEPGVTDPRIANLVVAQRGDRDVVLPFHILVDDDGIDDPLQYLFFINVDRDCLPRDGGSQCGATIVRDQAPSGVRRRVLDQPIRLTDIGCNRVEMWVSSRFRLNGNYHTPERDGDVASATWWVFVRPPPGTPTDPDAGTADPVERCQNLVRP